MIRRGSGGMADTHASGACARNRVRVQIPSSPRLSGRLAGSWPFFALLSFLRDGEI